MTDVETKNEAMGNLGDGEKNDGTLTIAAFLALYPEGVFRPEPPKKLVEVRVYPDGDEVRPYVND